VTGYEHTVFSLRAGSIVGTGFGCPRCFRVLDRSGRELTQESRVDLGTAFRALARSAEPGTAAGSEGVD
jgi:hypothetical protein